MTYDPPQGATTRTGLTREAVAQAALELLDREPLEALSMRRLAAELDVGTMTLYGYFRSKQELLDAVVDAAAATAIPDVLDAGGWRERLEQILVSLYRGLTRHPGIVRLRVDRPISSPAAMRVAEVALQLLEEAGLRRGEAVRAYRTLFVYTFGAAAFSQGGPDTRARTRAALAELPDDEFPVVAAAVRDLTSVLDDESQFAHGLRLLLDGVEHQTGLSSQS